MSDFNDVIIGIVGTGSMASAHAYRWSQYGIKVVIGSRDASRAQHLANQIGGGCTGTTHLGMIQQVRV